MTTSIRNHIGLMATPATACILDGHTAKPRLKAVTDTVNVAIGRGTALPVPCEFYATPGMDAYAYDCVYDPKRISLADAEKWVRTQLAEKGVKIGQFINEDEPDDACDGLCVVKDGETGAYVNVCDGLCVSAAEQAPEPDDNAAYPTALDRLADELPGIVDQAMRDTIPHKYSPALAAEIAADILDRLTGTTAPCPDGIAWCDGNPANHTDTDDHRHEGPEHNLSGSYVQGGGWTDSIMGFQLAQWSGGEPHLVFQGSGSWPDLTITQVDELIGDAIPWLTQLIATRRRLAIELQPTKTPFTETDEQQTASAGFDLATRAIDVALTNTGDRAGMLCALRAFLDMAEAEQAGGDR